MLTLKHFVACDLACGCSAVHAELSSSKRRCESLGGMKGEKRQRNRQQNSDGQVTPLSKAASFQYSEWEEEMADHSLVRSGLAAPC